MVFLVLSKGELKTGAPFIGRLLDAVLPQSERAGPYLAALISEERADRESGCADPCRLRELDPAHEFETYEHQSEEGKIEAALRQDVLDRHERRRRRDQQQENEDAKGSQGKTFSIDPRRDRHGYQRQQTEDLRVIEQGARDGNIGIDVLAVRQEKHAHIGPDHAALGEEIRGRRETSNAKTT